MRLTEKEIETVIQELKQHAREHFYEGGHEVKKAIADAGYDRGEQDRAWKIVEWLKKKNKLNMLYSCEYLAYELEQYLASQNIERPGGER